ncbi:PREDICTED: odorant receptor 85b-like [Polistes dominula]|uniref:Odorant receptor n=1 Tax=Polistes dominula TaxID=743375 RepID=A0ABM1IYJ8_POLDO|nr:PREDICTED: odorant receptor 85b-like [Polistes dominula]
MRENSICSPVEFGLRLIGLWPNYAYAMIHRIFWTITMIFVLFFECVYVVKHIKTDELPDLMDSLTITLSNGLLFCKLIILWLNDRILEGILMTIAEDYDNNEKDNDRERMYNKVILSQRFASCTILLYSTTVILFSVSVIFAPERVPVLKMELPFDAMKSPIYELVSILQFLQELLFASTSGLLNGLIVTLMLHLGGQAEIMCQKLTNISPKIMKEKSCKDTLKSLIDSHERIINFSLNVESVFTYIALLQFLSNTLAICFSGFVIITVNMSFDSDQGLVILAKTLPYYTVVNLEAFVLCFAGEYLTSKNDRSSTFSQGKAIGEAAYTSTWYELKPNESRYFLLLILRSQKRLTITVGKFMDLSLEGFASILKASASYVSVLYAMY